MKKLTGFSLFIFFCVVTAILTAGLVFYSNKNINIGSSNPNLGLNKTADVTTLASAGVTVLDFVEVAKHNTEANCWIIVNNKIYDISGYASAHPGGTRNITNYCGKESTTAFDTKGGNRGSHSVYANSLLDQYYVGDLNQKIMKPTTK